MGQYRKKPVVVDAFRLGDEWPDWWADAVSSNQVTTKNRDDRFAGGPDMALIMTLEGTMYAHKGDYIIRGVKGELYPCKPDIFEATYDPVEPPLDVRPDNCRFRLQDEGKPYPRSGCAACGLQLFTGLGNKCPRLTDTPPEEA